MAIGRARGIQCPRCGESGTHIKAGRNGSGTQRYRCRCGCITSPKSPSRDFKRERARLAIALLTKAGFSLRDVGEVGRLISSSPETVRNWLGTSNYKEDVHVQIEEAVFDEPAFKEIERRYDQLLENDLG